MRWRSGAIRESLRLPDILGVVEMENLSTLQTLGARIGTGAVAAGIQDPQEGAATTGPLFGLVAAWPAPIATPRRPNARA
jgi:hypothetical protein